MAKGGANFSSQELAVVLSHYDIGLIANTKPLSIGNRRAPKKILITDKGIYLLKRRCSGKDDLYHVAFSHAVQTTLEEHDYPVPGLVKTKQNTTAFELDGKIYEIFNFITGKRYSGTLPQTEDSGRRLAQFHLNLAGFAGQWMPLRKTFHNSPAVRRHLKTIVYDRTPTGPNTIMHETAAELLTIYNHSAISVNQLGFDWWKEVIVHSDWHPGNMLFSGDKIVVVLDYDSVKVAPAVTDLANGMLQFSIIARSGDPVNWPAEFDLDRMAAFLYGYQDQVRLEPEMVEALPELMIESMISESVFPIAATGFFGHMSGVDFLSMILRKCKWMQQNRKGLEKVLGREK